MLYYQAVHPDLLALLKNLQNEPTFSSFRLVGGTSLALQFGHRQSIDIDLFGNFETDSGVILKTIEKLGPVTLLKNTQNIHIYLIGGIKVDIVNYYYPWIEKPIVMDGLLLAGIRDIAAMKLNAISGRGSRKDFIDFYFLLKQFTISEMLEFYNQKYPEGSSFMVLKSLSYFEDADKQEMPVMLKQVTWEKAKNSIGRALNDYLK